MHNVTAVGSQDRNSYCRISGECKWIDVYLKSNVLPNGLNPIRYELVDNIPRMICPFSYTVCVCVCVCV